MTTTTNPAGLLAQCGAIALVHDRTALSTDPICSAWLIADQKVATVANVLHPFAKDLAALKVSFPAVGKHFGVKAIQFHPRFDRHLAKQTVERGTMANSPEAALQKFNCAILTLTEALPEITQLDIYNVSQALRFPLTTTSEGFHGSLKEIELPAVMQTINNARKVGILYICDDLNRPIAQIFFQNGQISSAKYNSLLNENALYQLVERGCLGKFVFRDCAQPGWQPPRTITQLHEVLLIEARRRLSDLEKIKTEIKGAKAFFVRAQRHLNIELIPEELKEQAGTLWRVLDGMTAAEQLWLLVGMDDYTIFRTLQEMNRYHQIRRVQDGSTREFDPTQQSSAPVPTWKPLSLGLQLPLQPFEEVASISLDPSNLNKPRVKLGSLLGAIDPFDTWHLLHDIPLLPSANGTPIFKENLVVGMHCGVVPSSPELENPTAILQQMLWIDAFAECLKSAGEVALVRKLTMADAVAPQIVNNAAGKAASKAADNAMDNATDKTVVNFAANKTVPPGCTEIAAIKCPRCGENTFESARSCRKCQFSFIPEQVKKPSAASKYTLAALSVIILSTCAAAAIAWSSLPAPHFEVSRLALLPNKPWLTVTIMLLTDAAKNVWEPQKPNSPFKNGDVIHFKIDANKQSYVYLLFNGTGASEASLMYPYENQVNLLREGASDHTMVGMELDPPSGPEKVIAFASEQPLEWLKETNNINSAYQYAYKLLENTHAVNGVEISVSQLESALSPPVSPSSDADKSSVFITSVTANHR
jgi:Domain of unknown function (DUF4388)/Domain of unknown function (DUF4384)